jgi:hypothetical protein
VTVLEVEPPARREAGHAAQGDRARGGQAAGARPATAAAEGAQRSAPQSLARP